MIGKLWLALLPLSLLTAGCAPPAAAPAPAPAPASVASAARVAPEPAVPVPPSYRDALRRGTRSETGAPGPRYWQQRVRYQIDAELDPGTATLRGRERIVYRNQSPDTLRSVVLNLYQNVFAEGVPRNRYVSVTGGITLERVAAQGRALEPRTARQIPVEAEPATGAPAGYAVRGTLARLVLPHPILPGDSATLEVEWRYRVPPAGAFRTAWEDALGGRAFQVAQWYPQVATYDDLHGWDATPYLGDGEFYLEYGDYDVALTLPAGWLVGATGELRNAEAVLTPEARRRLAAAAARAEGITPVVTAADLQARRATQSPASGRVTWRFRAEDVRDFGFAASDRYVWNAARAEVPGSDGGTRAVLVHALHRPGAPHWEQAARFGEHALEFFSRALVPYLYPQVTIAEGPVGGMEYPMLVFIGKPAEAEALYSVIAHEVGHEWFPMMVGSDEASFAWMDEGVTTFVEGRAFEDFFPGQDGFAGDLRRYLAVAGGEREVPLMRHTDLVSPYGARTVAAYSKPGVALRALRAALGDSVFDAALRTFAREWMLKHPQPLDFFHTVERVARRDLDWFWVPWFYETGVLDQAIAAVETLPGGATRVTVRDLGQNPMPTTLRIHTAAGDVATATIPVERWLREGDTVQLTLTTPGPVVRVELDPERLYPDAEPGNDVWTRE